MAKEDAKKQETTPTVNKNEHGQVVLPVATSGSGLQHAGSSAPHIRRSYAEETEEYLTRTGWKMLGTDERGVGIWEDPFAESLSKLPVVKKATVELPMSGDTERTEWVSQTVVPPVTWTYKTDEATAVQRLRDIGGFSTQKLIEVKEAELKVLKASLQSAA